MVKHIVFWKLEEHAQGRSAADNAVLVKERLESLRGEIPGLLHLEVGIDISRTDASADIALYSEFEDMAALDVYQVHPAHQAVVGFVGEVRTSRLVVDYEV
ncbi:MAG: Dabb family protein [Coriobacteriia bacterium]|nr:Dabb family protein [Coriobacteriia bacterium]